MEVFSHLTHNPNDYNHNHTILLVDDEKDILNLFVLAYRSLAMKLFHLTILLMP